MSPRKDAVAFVERLRQQAFPDVFNPYADQCAVWDLPQADAIRRLNLERVLEAALRTDVSALWVGQEPGWRGARRTGLALTDEVGLEDLAGLWGVPLRRATHGELMSEQTAKSVQPLLGAWPGRVFLWNAFHLHTHEPGKPLSNRQHTREEGLHAREPLLWLIDRLQPKRVIALGNVAADALRKAGVAHLKVRHPSRGGGPTFKADMGRLNSH